LLDEGPNEESDKSNDLHDRRHSQDQAKRIQPHTSSERPDRIGELEDQEYRRERQKYIKALLHSPEIDVRTDDMESGFNHKDSGMTGLDPDLRQVALNSLLEKKLRKSMKNKYKQLKKISGHDLNETVNATSLFNSTHDGMFNSSSDHLGGSGNETMNVNTTTITAHSVSGMNSGVGLPETTIMTTIDHLYGSTVHSNLTHDNMTHGNMTHDDSLNNVTSFMTSHAPSSMTSSIHVTSSHAKNVTSSSDMTTSSRHSFIIPHPGHAPLSSQHASQLTSVHQSDGGGHAYGVGLVVVVIMGSAAFGLAVFFIASSMTSYSKKSDYSSLDDDFNF